MTRLKSYINIIVLIVFLLMLCQGCSSKGNTTNGSDVGGIPTSSTEGTTEENKRYNSVDLAIVSKIDTVNMELTFISINDGRTYTLTYTGGTKVRSKNDVELSMSQMNVGEIVDVYYVMGSQKLIEIQESKSAWENNSVTRWDVDYDIKKITIGSSSYKYENNLFIDSNGKKIAIEEISGVDELIVRGVEGTVYSVIVERGHGFVQLVDETNMVDGLIEIGTKLMTCITEDMVIVAPEGTHMLTATKDGTGGSKEIVVVRDEVVMVSLSEFQAEVTRYGSINFNITPNDEETKLYIDGVSKDYSDLIRLPYGKHKIVITSDNYDTYEKIITVSSIYTLISIDLSGEETTSSETTTEETTEETTTESTSDNDDDDDSLVIHMTTNNNKVYVSSPVNVNVYVDGVHLGVTPITFDKEEGEHTVLLMKSGYASKVYMLNLDGTRQDIMLAYPDLVVN